jgi:exodeoxyribonuclease-3
VGTFKIATYNVNSIRSRIHIIIPWLRENSPDVLCMQETKVHDDKFPIHEFEDAGYQVVFRGEKQYNGVATASLKKPEAVSFGFEDDEPSDEDRLVQGRERESQPFAYKLRWFKRLRKYLEKSCSSAMPLVWCGDLNVAPEAIDVHDPKRLLGHVCFNPEVWEAFDGVKSWGFQDIFRKFHPGEPGHYTFFDYRVRGSVERGIGWRVDHILATGSLAKKSTNCEIDMSPRLAEKPSDHTVLIAEFELS